MRLRTGVCYNLIRWAAWYDILRSGTSILSWSSIFVKAITWTTRANDTRIVDSLFLVRRMPCLTRATFPLLYSLTTRLILQPQIQTFEAHLEKQPLLIAERSFPLDRQKVCLWDRIHLHSKPAYSLSSRPWGLAEAFTLEDVFPGNMFQSWPTISPKGGISTVGNYIINEFLPEWKLLAY